MKKSVLKLNDPTEEFQIHVLNAYTHLYMSESTGSELRTKVKLSIGQCLSETVTFMYRSESNTAVKQTPKACTSLPVREIPGSHGGDYEVKSLLGYSAVQSRWSISTFRRCVLLPSSG
jgi:hypothetical protein